MVLSRCNLMPHGMLPLFIFEPRYRAMLDHALKCDRMFALGFVRGDRESDETIDEYSTAGLVRACVRHGDGTAHLVLEGVKRIRLGAWEQREPFRIAAVSAVETTLCSEGEIVELSAGLIERATGVLRRGGAGEMADRIAGIENPEILADFVAANFVSEPDQRQPLLGMASLEERLRYLLELLPEGE